MTTAVLLREYVQLRNMNLSATDALQFLRPRLEALSPEAQRELVHEIRLYEDKGTGKSTAKRGDAHPPVSKPPDAPAKSAIKPIALIPAQKRPAAATGSEKHAITSGKRPQSVQSITPVPLSVPAEIQTPCPQCGTRNRTSEFFCTQCGYFLKVEARPFATVRLQEASAPRAEEYYDADTLLVLHLRETGQHIGIRPQDHEMIIGRSDETVKPDIDLAAVEGKGHGVSRMHLAIGYDAGNHVVTASDLGSSNGSFVNGQRIFPKEVRTLRHNDELRLGTLVMIVQFHRA